MCLLNTACWSTSYIINFTQVQSRVDFCSPVIILLLFFPSKSEVVIYFCLSHLNAWRYLLQEMLYKNYDSHLFKSLADWYFPHFIDIPWGPPLEFESSYIGSNFFHTWISTLTKYGNICLKAQNPKVEGCAHLFHLFVTPVIKEGSCFKQRYIIIFNSFTTIFKIDAYLLNKSSSWLHTWKLAWGLPTLQDLIYATWIKMSKFQIYRVQVNGIDSSQRFVHTLVISIRLAWRLPAWPHSIYSDNSV